MFAITKMCQAVHMFPSFT